MPNHLISEKSPYLLQHVNNPVDWYAWGPEAFEKARRENKPIFLSVGYSTCHWCHVMERESFENAEIAELLNRDFVAIKVDREERPDVDRIYMLFVQATTGSGGWPMSVFLTPELKPFFGGTYFPPDNRYGRPGFAAVLQSLARAWKQEREKIDQSSRDVIEQLVKHAEASPARASTLDKTLLDGAYQSFRRGFDSTHGGFNTAPKFPRPVVLNFLFRYYERTRNEEALEMALKTLRAMAEGGMNDQLGGGFHRYSVDEMWFLPHFEKMLYDQAQLAISYVEAYQITGDEYYAGIARDVLDYVMRDMTHPEGGFYSAEDADSVIDPQHPHEKGEGAFYVWTKAEIEQVPGKHDAAIFCLRYGVEQDGNVHHDPHGEFGGRNVLFVNRSIEQVAQHFKMPADLIQTNLGASIQKLLARRAGRVRPHLDDKILTGWNGLMISAFAKAAQVLNDPKYREAGRRAADFIVTKMYDPSNGKLLRRYREGDAAIPGFLEDYAFLAQAMLDLYETEFRAADIETAIRLTDTMVDLFEDQAGGAFFASTRDNADLVLRMKDDYDGAEPSGNAVALLVLLRLAQMTDRPAYAEAVERTLKGLGSKIAHQAVAVPQMLVGLNLYQSPRRQVVIAGDPEDERTIALVRAVRARFLPNTAVLLAGSAKYSEAVRAMKPVDGQPAAYVCENFACQLPVTRVGDLAELLK